MTPEEEHYTYLKLKQKQAMAAQAQQQAQQPQPPDMSGSFPEIRNVVNSDASIPQKLWQGLQVPGQMAQRGLSQLSEQLKPEPEYTGNLPRDIIKNYPSMSADVLSKVAPSFISRPALIAGAAGKAIESVAPLIKTLAKGAGAQAESLTGAVPGSLEAAAKDPMLMATGSKGAAKPLYASAQAELPYEQTIFKGLTKPQDIVDKAVGTIDKGGKLEPQEGLIARKSLDKIKNKLSQDAFTYYRNALDSIAKSNEDIAAADPLHQRGIYAQSLRNLLPQNKYGGASAFKLGIMTALEQMGVPGKVALAMMSPAAAGVAATGAGVAARAAQPILQNAGATAGLNELGHNPDIKQALLQILQRIKGGANAGQVSQ